MEEHLKRASNVFAWAGFIYIFLIIFSIFGLPSTTDLANFLVGHYGKGWLDEEIFLLKVFIVWFGLNSVAYILGGKFRFLPWKSLEEYEEENDYALDNEYEDEYEDRDSEHLDQKKN